MVGETHLDPAWGYTKTPPRGYNGNTRVIWVIPHQITLTSLLYKMDRINNNLWTNNRPARQYFFKSD